MYLGVTHRLEVCYWIVMSVLSELSTSDNMGIMHTGCLWPIQMDIFERFGFEDWHKIWKYFD